MGFSGLPRNSQHSVFASAWRAVLLSQPAGGVGIWQLWLHLELFSLDIFYSFLPRQAPSIGLRIWMMTAAGTGALGRRLTTDWTRRGGAGKRGGFFTTWTGSATICTARVRVKRASGLSLWRAQLAQPQPVVDMQISQETFAQMEMSATRGNVLIQRTLLSVQLVQDDVWKLILGATTAASAPQFLVLWNSKANVGRVSSKVRARRADR